MDEFIQIEYFLEYTDIMVFSDSTQNYFGQIPFLVRAALAHSPFQPQSSVPFEYNVALKRAYLSGVGITLEKSGYYIIQCKEPLRIEALRWDRIEKRPKSRQNGAPYYQN